MPREKVSVKVSFSITPTEFEALKQAVDTSTIHSQSNFLRQMLRKSLAEHFFNNFQPATTTFTGEAING